MCEVTALGYFTEVCILWRHHTHHCNLLENWRCFMLPHIWLFPEVNMVAAVWNWYSMCFRGLECWNFTSTGFEIKAISRYSLDGSQAIRFVPCWIPGNGAQDILSQIQFYCFKNKCFYVNILITFPLYQWHYYYYYHYFQLFTLFHDCLFNCNNISLVVDFNIF